MIGSSREKDNRDGLRCQSAKSDRDPHRVCPSKLSKKELEDLYFSLMDTNLELKKTVNMQQDSIKMLNTRVSRLITAQRCSIKENSCCAPTKAIVLDQKDTIADLKKANERMSDKIRILNMRLCSAKQFLKRCPSQANARCFKCFTASSAFLKNSSVSVIHSKRSETEHKPSGTPTQRADKERLSTRSVEIETDDGDKENVSSTTLCKENKCRTLIEELKQKIVDLQQESSKLQSEYSTRIARLEDEMTSLQVEYDRVKRERAASLQSLQMKAQREHQLSSKLRDAEAQCNELASQLLIEKSKVAELETRVKAANLASLAAKALEKHQKTNMDDPDADECLNRSPLTAPTETDLDEIPKAHLGKKESSSTPCMLLQHTYSSPDINPREPPSDQPPASSQPPDTSPNKSKHSDDSGYNDNPRTSADDEALAKINKELEKKITDLQDQLDTLRIASAGLKNEQQSINKEPNNVEIKSDDSTNQDRTYSIDAKNAGIQSMDSERKGNLSPERTTSNINRANETWAKTERSSQDSCESSPSRLIDKAKDSHKDKAKKKSENEEYFELNGTDTFKIDEESTEDSNNELRHKIKDTARDKSAHAKAKHNAQADIRRCSKLDDACESDVPTQDFSRHDQISKTIRPYIDTNGDFKRDSNTAGERRRNPKIKDSGGKVMDIREDKRANHSRDVIKYIARKGRRDSKIEIKEKDTHDLNDVNNQYDTIMSTRIQINSDEDSVASDGIHSPVAVPKPFPRRVSMPQYSVPHDDTDHEISHLSDLPNEKDDKTPRDVLSPGEQRTSSTYTDTYTDPSTEIPSLSEGEMLVPNGRRRSLGEAKNEAGEVKTAIVSVSQRMEEALVSIGEELARCRHLLHSQSEVRRRAPV